MWRTLSHHLHKRLRLPWCANFRSVCLWGSAQVCEWVDLSTTRIAAYIAGTPGGRNFCQVWDGIYAHLFVWMMWPDHIRPWLVPEKARWTHISVVTKIGSRGIFCQTPPWSQLIVRITECQIPLRKPLHPVQPRQQRISWFHVVHNAESFVLNRSFMGAYGLRLF